MISRRSKVIGMFIGVSVGDALGMPVETWNRETIKQKYPEGLKEYKTPDGHKWFTGQSSGSVTDDTQLTIAVAKGLIEAKTFDFAEQAKQHVAALKETTAGWGHTTIESIRRLANGVSWLESGKTSDARRGTGNGVPMRVAPLAAWLLVAPHMFPFNEELVKFSAMTHYSKMSAFAGIIHTRLLFSALMTQPAAWVSDFDFIDGIEDCFKWEGTKDDPRFRYDVSHLNDGDDFKARMLKVRNSFIEKWSDERIEQEFGGGSCYVYDSLPFSYAYFVRNPKSIKTLYEVAEAGGDTDSNASMVGALLGALNGFEFWEKHPHLLLELNCFDEIEDLANQFCDTFGIE